MRKIVKYLNSGLQKLFEVVQICPMSCCESVKILWKSNE